MTQRDFPWRGRLWISIDGAVSDLATGRFKDELCAPLTRPIRDADIRATLEAIAGFRAQPEGFRSAANIGWEEAGAFDQNVARRVVDFGVLSTHHSGKSDGLLFVRNEQHFVCERAFLAVECGEFLAAARTANDDGRNLVAADVRRRIAVVPLLRSWATSDQKIIERVQ